MKLFLEIKHWMIFLIFIIPGYLINASISTPIIIAFLLALYSLWLYSVGVLGQRKLTEMQLKGMNTTLFTVSCISLTITWLLAFSFSSNIIAIVASVLFILGLFQSIYIVSLTLTRLGVKYKLVWIMAGFIFPPVGVWFLQPRINGIPAMLPSAV